MKLKIINIIIFITIIFFGAFLRFYKLNWDGGIFPHPDENSLIGPVSQLSFPNQMNSHLFTYGSGITYPIYFTRLVLQNFNIYIHPLLIGRFYSALFSTLTILLIYLITLTITSRGFALLAAFLTATTAGLIQQAHFATPEASQTFFLLMNFLCLLYFLKKQHYRWLVFASLCFGWALAIKVSSIYFAPIFLATLTLIRPFNFVRLIQLGFVSLITTLFIFIVLSPFVFLNWSNFSRVISYESQIASGSMSIFYTRQFIDTVSVIFQLIKIFPYALGPALEILGILGLLVMLIMVFRKFNQALFLILIAFSLLFIPSAFLFVKWTRYMTPILPFFAVFTAFFLYQFSQKMNNKYFPLILNPLFLILTVFWALAFFSIYTKADVRITANNWLETNLPENSVILGEFGNTVVLPLGGNYQKLTFNFYDLDTFPTSFTSLTQNLAQADYFLVESRRVFYNHQRLPDQFPKTANLYNQLFAGSLGFQQIAEFHSSPQLAIGNWSLIIPDETAEETWTSFDHPVIRVFKKVAPLTKSDYEKLL